MTRVVGVLDKCPSELALWPSFPSLSLFLSLFFHGKFTGFLSI
jgi:hypothetical protein